MHGKLLIACEYSWSVSALSWKCSTVSLAVFWHPLRSVPCHSAVLVHHRGIGERETERKLARSIYAEIYSAAILSIFCLLLLVGAEICFLHPTFLIPEPPVCVCILCRLPSAEATQAYSGSLWLLLWRWRWNAFYFNALTFHLSERWSTPLWLLPAMQGQEVVRCVWWHTHPPTLSSILKERMATSGSLLFVLNKSFNSFGLWLGCCSALLHPVEPHTASEHPTTEGFPFT